MSDRNDFDLERNIALLIDADNASPDPPRRRAARARRARHDQHPPRLRQLGQGQPQGLGRADRPPFDHAGPAVRRRQGQERDRHADDDRRDGPAVRRPCRRLRDHVERQRLPAAGDAHPQDGLPVYGFGTAKTPISFQQACTRFFDVAALASQKDDALEPPPAERGPARGRCRAAPGARRGVQGVEARRATAMPR